jgi:2-C-methyl-D-erythritol 4-phosphate cytidylyltransferase
VAGRPLLDWSLDAMAATGAIGPVVVALPPGVSAELPPGVAAVAGGVTRSESVAAALQAVETELVVVHDAARPLVAAELIDAVIVTLLAHPDAQGVIAAAPITDTVKRAQEGRTEDWTAGAAIAATESRDQLWAAQTPQAFRTDALRGAFELAAGRLAEATDEAMLVEWAGGRVLLEPSLPTNLKVTTPADLRLVELLLADR